MDAIKTRAVDAGLAGARGLIDYLIVRVALLVLGVMLSAAVLGVVAYRLTIGRRGSVA